MEQGQNKKGLEERLSRAAVDVLMKLGCTWWKVRAVRRRYYGLATYRLFLLVFHRTASSRLKRSTR